MSIFDQLIGSLAPHECLGCGLEGGLVCGSCAEHLGLIPERCYRCRQASAEALTCPICRGTSNLHRVQVATIYGGIAKDLIWSLKFAGAQTAAELMAARMTLFIQDTSANTIIVPVPTATSRTRQRGYDQARLLARGVAGRSRLPYVDCLARVNQTHQVGASRQQRLAQLNGAFRVKRPYVATDANVILIDDVITTGATLEAAATALRAAGAARVEALVFARPETF